jgi:prohibitin 2
MSALRNIRPSFPIGSVGLLLGVAAVGIGIQYSLFNGKSCISSLTPFAVEGGHRAVMFSRLSGVKQQIYSEGTHFMIPWFETPIDYDVRAKPRNMASLTGTKDLQMVNITVRVLSRPQIDQLPKIYKTLGTDFDERVLPSVLF